MKKGLVSVMIPTIPKREYCVGRALQSVSMQSYSNIETIIVNDSSISSPKARNKGISISNGDFISLLDDDDTWYPFKTEKQIQIMNEHPDCPLVICWSRDLRFGRDRICKTPEIVTHDMLIKSFNLSSSSSYLIRKSILDIEPFDISLHSAQEYDLAIRLSKHGDIRCVQEVLMTQNSTANQISENWNRKIKGILGICKKHHSEFGIFEYVKMVGLLVTFFGGFIVGNRIYSFLIPLRERYESSSLEDYKIESGVVIMTKKDLGEHLGNLEKQSKVNYDVVADWQLNLYCNYDCDYCFVKGRKDSSKNGRDIQDVVKAFDNTNLVWLVHMSGGETFLHPNFVEMCKLLTEKHYISINTNLSTKNVFEFADEINPSRVEFVHASFHLRQVSDIDKFIKRIKYLKEKGFRIKVSSVFSPSEINLFKMVYNILKKENIILEPKALRGYYKNRLYPNSYTLKEKETFKKYSNDNEEIELINGELGFEGNMCEAGQKFVRILYNGDVLRCHGEYSKLGNIYQNDLKLYKSAQLCRASICKCPYYGLRYSCSPTVMSETVTRKLKHKADNILKKVPYGEKLRYRLGG